MIDSNQRLLKLHYSHLIKFRSLNLLVSLRKVIKIHKTMELEKLCNSMPIYIINNIFKIII